MKEIERRVALSAEEADVVIAKLKQAGAVFTDKKRLIVDFSGDLSTRERTVMVRVNDGTAELVAKTGGVREVERSESQIAVEEGLEDALNYMAIMGYSEASYGFRSMRVCEDDGVEYSFRYAWDMNNLSKLIGINLEVELTREGTVEELDAKLDTLGLVALTDDEAVAVFQRFHSDANGNYQHSPEAAQKLVQDTKAFMSS